MYISYISLSTRNPSSREDEPFAPLPRHNTASLIRSSRNLTAFTGMGISVEKLHPTIPGSRRALGKYDPHTLEVLVTQNIDSVR
jgi:hypothetical protein